MAFKFIVPVFLMSFGSKRNLFQVILRLLLFQHLAPPIGRPSCQFEQYRSLTVKLLIVLVLTWRPQETNFLTFFGSKRNFFPDKFASFIVSAPCTSNKTALLGVRATSRSYSKNTKRFSADHKTTKTKFFDVFWLKTQFFSA